MTAHVLLRLKSYLVQHKTHQDVDGELLRSFVPELKSFCFEEQKGASELLLKSRILARKNELLKTASFSNNLLDSLSDYLSIVRSQLKVLDVLLKTTTVQDRHYTALVQNDTPSGPLRAVKTSLIAVEKELKRLETMLADEVIAACERQELFDAEYERASHQAREIEVSDAFEHDTKSRMSASESVVKQSGRNVATLFEGIIKLYEAYFNTFTKACDHIALLEKEISTSVQAQPLFRESFAIGELLL